MEYTLQYTHLHVFEVCNFITQKDHFIFKRLLQHYTCDEKVAVDDVVKNVCDSLFAINQKFVPTVFSDHSFFVSFHEREVHSSEGVLHETHIVIAYRND